MNSEYKWYFRLKWAVTNNAFIYQFFRFRAKNTLNIYSHRHLHFYDRINLQRYEYKNIETILV